MATKKKTAGEKKIDKTMHEWGQNKLNSSSGTPVKSQAQALAISFSQKKKADAKAKNKK